MAAKTKRPQIIQITLPTPLGDRPHMVRIPQRPPSGHRPHPPNLQRRCPRLPPAPLQLRISRHRIGPTQPTHALIPEKHLVPQIPWIGPQPPLVHAIVRAKRPPPLSQNLHPTPPAKRPPVHPNLDRRLATSPRQPPPRLLHPRPLLTHHPPILAKKIAQYNSVI
jgi:hypothetical protein